ncbi:MAG: RNA polymerase sigma factor [Planctomycetaceae bacterium]|nr:RNA polymerase sigma factor [Planctomycetaceae bacterium]
MESVTKILCEQAQAGSREAYDRLFALHTDRALLFIRSRLGPKLRTSLESRDVLQDAYLAAHQGFGDFTYTDDGAFLRWLCRIIDHRLCDLGNHFAALKRQPVELPRADISGPLTQLDRVEHQERVARALDTLSEDHRQVLLLRFFQGLSAEEAGQLLQRSPGAVRNLTARALVELGKNL